MKQHLPTTKLLFCALLFLAVKNSHPQEIISPSNKKGFVTSNNDDLFGKKYAFIENVGQYGKTMSGRRDMGKIFFAYEGFDLPVLFTSKGLIFCHRTFKKPSMVKHDDLKREEDDDNELFEKGLTPIDRIISMKWVDASPNVKIIMGDETTSYYTYGLMEKHAKGFKKITYSNLYPNIDVTYSFVKSDKPGFEYSIIVKPGGDLNKVKMGYGGDVRLIKKDGNGNLIVRSDINEITESSPFYYYKSQQEMSNSRTAKNALKFLTNENIVRFETPKEYNNHDTLIIDPFVASTASLTSINANIAKDIDFDYSGNVFVSGGGTDLSNQLAKYNSNGVLQWTYAALFTFIPPNSNWVFGLNYGGWVVDKLSGKIYLGQGWGSPNGGTEVVRFTSSGTYDSYITQANPEFMEGWKLLWVCNNGNPKIFVAGGGPVSNINFGICSPPSKVVSVQNITGITNTNHQDIADAVIDPLTNDMYTLFGSPLNVPKNLYKHSPSYLAANIAWNTDVGFNVFKERNNRPYLAGSNVGNDNSVNALAVNSKYLFYWDGKNLKAFDKSTGNAIGTAISITSNTALWQGGIIADECGNVFVGSINGTIKVYKFDGVNFDDSGAPDIIINGYSSKSVYDLSYDPARKLIYACGNGFVSSIDVSSYCSLETYSMKLKSDCINSSITASFSPSPPSDASIDYYLYDGQTLISSNSTGVFASLNSNKAYTLKAIINQNCSGIQLISDASITGPIQSITSIDVCNSSLGSVTINGSGGVSPYTYSIDDLNFQTNNLFTGLAAGNYTATIKDANGCTNKSNVAIAQISNCLSATTLSTAAICNSNTGSLTINVTNGQTPFAYSIDGINFQGSNVFSGLKTSNYKITIKDATGMMNAVDVFVPSNNSLKAVGTSATETCLGKDGSINVSASGVTGVPRYSLDGVTFQANNSFPNLSSGMYAVVVKDDAGCIDTIGVTVPFKNTLTVKTDNDTTICEGDKISLLVTSNGNSYTWTPAIGLNNASIANPTASPGTTTNYKVKVQLGICTLYDSITVFVYPAPIPNAGNDTTICFGQSVQLNANGGEYYSWGPSTFLANTNSSNPLVIRPSRNITYFLNVVDRNGCRSIKRDTVKVNVMQVVHVFAGSDTAVLINQPFQLDATDLNGNVIHSYLWSPPIGLSNPNIFNPVATLNSDMAYTVTGYANNGCEGSDTIQIKVYTKSDIYVPTAFTPNGDGKNDYLKAFPFGIKEFKYFTVYNRWGQIVFSTSDYSKGWDGTIAGSAQPNAVFVWIAKGLDYKGNVIEKKGSTVLIR